MENVNQVVETGFDTFLQNQFASTITPYPDPRPNDSVNNVQQTFFLNAIAGGDQLRMRTTLALNELWVVSGQTINDPLGYTNYLRALSKDALGNYLNLMTDVTLTPAMGNFLNMVNNDAPPPGEHANENYAREIMQLFTLGLNQLNPDGTPVLDSSGNPIPTYTQADVMDLGRAFTGWTYPADAGHAVAESQSGILRRSDDRGGKLARYRGQKRSWGKRFRRARARSRIWRLPWESFSIIRTWGRSWPRR